VGQGIRTVDIYTICCTCQFSAQ